LNRRRDIVIRGPRPFHSVRNKKPDQWGSRRISALGGSGTHGTRRRRCKPAVYEEGGKRGENLGGDDPIRKMSEGSGKRHIQSGGAFKIWVREVLTISQPYKKQERKDDTSEEGGSFAKKKNHL